MVLLGSWRAVPSGLALVSRAEGFFGTALRLRPIALTSTRVLLLPRHGSRGAGGWFDVQYDRRRVSASRPVTLGGAIEVELLTGLGPQLLRAPSRQADAVDDFARRLGYRPR